jgi:prephenate dehydrogenase
MRIGIIGLGLIGGTIAKTLKDNHKISAFDISKASLEYAMENDIVHEVYYNLENFISNNDIFYLCLYPKSIVEFISNNINLFKKGSIIIEISGVKKFLVDEISKLNLHGIDVVFSHPVAGSEKVGIYNSEAKIFENANYVISPVDFNKKSSLELAKSLAKEMGFLNISFVSPKVHDDVIAYTSQLTHVLSLSLVNSISAVSPKLDTKRFIGDSYRDLTRISKINENLWPDLFTTNQESLVNMISSFESELRKFKDAIIMNDNEKLKNLMIKSTNTRKNMDRGDSDGS